MSDRIASRSDWKTKPMPRKRQVLPFSRTFSQKEMEAIQRGLVPEEMEDKWFIFCENDHLFFHRSWTGFCVYTVEFIQRGDGYSVAKAEVNRNSKQYTETDDATDIKMVSTLIDRLLLNRQAE